MQKNNYLLWFAVTSTTLIAYISYLIYRISPFSFGNIVYYCQSLLSATLKYIPFASVSLLLGFFAIRLFIWHRQMSYIRKLPQISQPKKLKTILKKYSITTPIHIFEDTSPYAFCYGLYRPSIYLSSSLLQLMSSAELTAVLLHEEHHIQQNDTRIITILRTISLLLFPFPFFWEITHAYSTQQEIRADHAIFAKTASYTALKSALCKLLANPQTKPLPIFALSFTGYQVYAARIQAIQGSQVTITISKKTLYFSLASLAALSCILLLPVNKTEYKVNGHHYMVMCYDDQKCEMSCSNPQSTNATFFTEKNPMSRAQYQSK